MKTKLVYVLTCSSDSNYIEQALMAVYSARHWNPSAEIILIVDDQTDRLIASERHEILKYVSRIIVVPFDGDETMMYRSRWIKTSVRALVEGDFLFVDSDTITTRPLDDIDQLPCLMGAVPDSNLPVKEFRADLLKSTKRKIAQMDLSLDKEEYYFSSGVLYVKDVPQTHDIYTLWHTLWLDGVSKGVQIDQPSLAIANIKTGHLIERIPDAYNCIMYTQPDFAKDAFILHFAAYRNPSWLFTKRVYQIIQAEGIPDWLVPFILDPIQTYIPFRYSVSKMSLRELLRNITRVANVASIYSTHIASTFSDMKEDSHWYAKARKSFSKKHYNLGAMYCLFPTWLSIKIHPRRKPVPNICSQ